MTDETIVALYDTAAHAEAAVADLHRAGIPPAAVSQHAKGPVATVGTVQPRPAGFWAGLFGGEPEGDGAVYDRSLENGGTVVTVRVAQAEAARVTEILERHTPVDLEDRASDYGLSAAAPAAAAPATVPVAARTPASPVAPGTARDAETLRLAEEELSVGKRVVNRGGTRIRRYVVETPVQQEVSLHSEKVTLERHPVTGAPVADDAFTEKTIELVETAEEAVISKQAHVYEEVALRKDVTDRVETVRDTVRKEQVEVEQLPGGPDTPAAPVRPAPRV